MRHVFVDQTPMILILPQIQCVVIAEEVHYSKQLKMSKYWERTQCSSESLDKIPTNSTVSLTLEHQHRYVDQWLSEPENRPIYEVGPIQDWNVSGLTDLSYVFCARPGDSRCNTIRSEFNADISRWNVHQVTSLMSTWCSSARIWIIFTFWHFDIYVIMTKTLTQTLEHRYIRRSRITFWTGTWVMECWKCITFQQYVHWMQLVIELHDDWYRCELEHSK